MKIKTGLIFVSWLMILAHGIIPHNHIESDACEHAGYVHNHHAVSESHEYRELCSDFETCSISNILFQKFASDDYPLVPEISTIDDPFLPEERYTPPRNGQKPDNVFFHFILLRAPPLA